MSTCPTAGWLTTSRGIFWPIAPPALKLSDNRKRFGFGATSPGSTRSEADAGCDRIQGGADTARRRAHRTEVPQDPMKDCSSEAGVERNFQPSRKGVRK